MQIEDAIIISPAFCMCLTLYYDYMCSQTDFKKKVIFIHLQESPILLYCMYVCAGYMYVYANWRRHHHPPPASLACTPPLQERDHTSELGTLIPQSTCKLGRKFENSPRSESNAAKFLGDEHIGGQPLTTLWTAKERLCQNFFLKLAAAFVLNNLSQSASKGSLIGESFLFKNKMYFWDAFSHRDVFM